MYADLVTMGLYVANSSSTRKIVPFSLDYLGLSDFLRSGLLENLKSYVASRLALLRNIFGVLSLSSHMGPLRLFTNLVTALRILSKWELSRLRYGQFAWMTYSWCGSCLLRFQHLTGTSGNSDQDQVIDKVGLFPLEALHSILKPSQCTFPWRVYCFITVRQSIKYLNFS